MSKFYTKKRKYKHKYLRKLEMYKFGTKTIALVLVAIISLSAVMFQNKQPPADAAEKVLQSANVGYPDEDSITAKLYDDGVLNIEVKSDAGAVELWNNDYGSSPFAEWTGIQSITFSGINDNAYISAIGDNAFYGVKIDGSGDFELNLPERLASIKPKAFYQFGKSSSRDIKVNLPESLQSIGQMAFCDIANLKSIKIPSKVYSIDLNAFKGCSNLSSITLADGISSIGNYAFQGTSIKEVTIPSSVRSISNGAFSSNSLKKVYIKYESKDIEAMNSSAIDGTAFSSSASLIFDSSDIRDKFKTKFPSISNTEIFPLQIKGLNSSYDKGDTLSFPTQEIHVSTDGGTPNTTRTLSIKDSNVGGITSGSTIDGGNLDLSNKTIGEFTVAAQVNGSSESYDYAEFKVQIINSTTGECGSELTSDYDAVNKTLTIKGSGDMFDYDDTTLPKWSNDPTEIENIVFTGGGITKIGANAFKGLTGLTSIEIPSTVTSIGESAFEDCSSLTSATISGILNSESTGTGIFKGCLNLATVKFAEGTTTIPDSTFYDCPALSTITLANSITSIGANSFSNCTGLNNITLPNALTSIGDEAFSACSSLENIKFPNSLTTIGDDAFSNCIRLENITFSSSLSSIGNNAFFGCSDLNDITLPSSVRSIGDSAFLSCLALSRVDFDHTATEISELTLGKSAFNVNPNSPKIILMNEFAKIAFDYEVLSAEGTTTNTSAGTSLNSSPNRSIINQWQTITQSTYNSIGKMTARYNTPTVSVGETVSKDNFENFVLGGDHDSTLSLFFDIGSSTQAQFNENGDLEFLKAGNISTASAYRAKNKNDQPEDYNQVSNIKIQVNPGNIQSVTNPSDIKGLSNGTAKTAKAFGLPNDITVLLEGGNTYNTTVTWDVDNCSYDQSSKAQQTFTVTGTINTNEDIKNPNNITALANVTVNAYSSDPSNPSNPSNPSDPSNPSNPSNPSDPSNPSNPSNPSDPSNPSNPSNPSGSSDSSDQSNSSGSSGSSDQSNNSGTPTPGNTSGSSNTSTNTGGTTYDPSVSDNGYDSYSAAQATGERSRTILSIIGGVYVVSLCGLIILRKRIKRSK